MSHIINEKLYKIKHTMTLVLAFAVNEVFSKVKLGTGTVSENEFFTILNYHDLWF